MKKLLVLALVLGLVAGSMALPAEAKKKKKKKKPVPVATDIKYFLRRDDCANFDAGDNTRLSTEDGEDAACSWDDAGLPWEVYEESGLAQTTEIYATENGTPLTLDASRHLTGELQLYQAPTCIEDPACAPVGLTAGQATFTVSVIATIAGEDKLIGTIEDTFTTTPGSTHMTKLDFEIDPAMDRAVVESLRLEAFHGGQALGPGGIEYEDPAAYITVPVFALPGTVPAAPPPA